MIKNLAFILRIVVDFRLRSIDFVPTIQNLINDNSEYSRMKAAMIGMTMPHSTESIIREINAHRSLAHSAALEAAA